MEIKNDISFLIGKSIQKICFSLFQIELYFDQEEIRICVFDSLIFLDKNLIKEEWNYKNGRKEFSLNSLIEVPINRADVNINSNLRIEFENGESIEIKSAKEGNESYILHRNSDFQVIY